ncbi:MAG: CDGSH iron-sulfur domain-containing protein [Dehalococcoidia bacterium]|nr:CDGSH iron-sulfur domain-containing protein [Dehalococcoidia bacterium]
MDDSKLKKQPRIRVSKDGPYVVTGGVPMAEQIILKNADGDAVEWCQGEEFETKQTYSLCRCGHSNNKPYCDGSHLKEHFDGTEVASKKPYMEQATTVEGPDLNLTDSEELCALALFCDRAGDISPLVEHSDDPEFKAIAIQEAKDCPSGRLVVWNKDGTPIEPTLEPSIGVIEEPDIDIHGPLWVRGGIPIVSADGITYEVRNRVTLCRCGRSANMPFCDGTHAADE